VIDDEKDMVDILEVRLNSHGYEIIKATNGKIGCDIARKENPDLILLDIMMPGLSGEEIVKLLKKDSATKDIPIVFLSAALNKGDKKEIEIDGSHFQALAKPFYQLDLLSVIKKSLKKKNG